MNKILKNVFWLVFDRIFILILQFFIGVKIANYYGSELFGIYNYIAAIMSFSAIFFELINPRVIKKYYTEENYDNIVFNSSFFRNAIAIFLFVVSLLIKFFMSIEILSYLILIFLALDNVLVTTTMGIENFFEYKLEAKKIVISNNIVKIISYSLQYIGIILGYSIIMIPIVRCIGSLIRMLILKFLYKRNYKIKRKKKVDKILLSNILKDSFYLWASFVAFLIYTQLDKIMLGNMLGKKEVGVYSIGVQLSQILAIIIVPIQNSLFPKMFSLYKENYQKYYIFFLKMNYFITQIYIWGSLCSIFIVKYTFKYLFATEYNEAITVYNILILGVLLKANGALQTSHMTIREITKKSFYKTVLGVFINMTLNYFFIKKYALIGAAIATSITQIFTLFIIDFFIKEYKEQAFIQLKSFNPFLYLKIKEGKKNV